MKNSRNFATRRKLIFGGTTVLGTMAVMGGQTLKSQAETPVIAQANPVPKTAGRFSGKVAVITGATSGIGEATAKAFASEGAKVVFCGRRVELGKKVEQQIRQAGGEALFVKAYVMNATEVSAFIAAAIKAYGRIDIAFNNAGIVGDAGRNTHEVSDANWERVFRTNLDGILYAMRYEIPHMLKQKSGVIVNNASTLGLSAVAGLPAYVASKHAVIGITKAAAMDYVTSGIRVNAIAPGPIYTPLAERFIDGKKEVYDAIANKVPMKRFGKPEEVAQAVLWLCAEESAFVTGHVHTIDGGIMAFEA